jgi:outer membrane protein OmpA-like peptidoglycan-associated protein
VTRNGILLTGIAALLGLALLCTRQHYQANAPVAAVTSPAPATTTNQQPLVATSPVPEVPPAAVQAAKPVDAPAPTSLPQSVVASSNKSEIKLAARQERIAKAKENLAIASALPKKVKAKKAIRSKKAVPISAAYKRAYACDQPTKANLIGSICFDFDSAKLTAQSKLKLDKLVPTLKETAKKIELSGFADSRGRQGYNQTLSQLRGDAVQTYLLSKGVDIGKLTIAAYGSQAGKQFQKQRRVDLKVMQL